VLPTGCEGTEQENSALQAECNRLREELIRERAERCALAMRVDALSRMWEAAGLSGEMASQPAASTEVSEVPSLAVDSSAVPPEPSDELPSPSGWDASAAGAIGESQSQGLALESVEGLVTPEQGSPNTGLHSSVQTIMDESSIVPESSAVIGLPGFTSVTEANDATPKGRHSYEVDEEESGSTPILRPLSPTCGSHRRSPRTASPPRQVNPSDAESQRLPGNVTGPGGVTRLKETLSEGPGRIDSMVADARGILAEMTASGVLDRDLGLRRALKEEGQVCAQSEAANGSTLAFYRKRCLEVAREVRGVQT